MSSPQVAGGVVHELPADLRDALAAHAPALEAWNDIPPLARAAPRRRKARFRGPSVLSAERAG